MQTDGSIERMAIATILAVGGPFLVYAGCALARLPLSFGRSLVVSAVGACGAFAFPAVSDNSGLGQVWAALTWFLPALLVLRGPWPQRLVGAAPAWVMSIVVRLVVLDISPRL